METPVDGGYSWVILLVTWINYLVVAGCCKSFGLLYAELLDHYGTGSGNTAWIQSLSLFLLFALGPISNYLGEVYTFRAVMLAGGVLGSLGIFLSAFVTKMEYWYITYGLITGIGFGLLYTPCTTIVNFYFEKRRALANGIVIGGSGFGAFLLPYVYRSLIDYYGLFGALLFISAIFLNSCVGSMFVRQPTTLQKRLVTFKDAEGCKSPECQPLTNLVYDQDREIKKKKQKCHFPVMKLRRPLFDLSLFQNGLFALYVLGFTLTILGYSATFVIIPGHIVKLGYSKQDIAIGMSVVGAAEVFARPFFGWFADLKLFKLRFIIVFCLLLSAITSMSIPYFTKFHEIVIYCATVGIFPAAFWSLMSVLILETTSLTRLPPALGLLSLSLSSAVIIGAPIAGWIEDASTTWDNSFRFVGFSHLIAAAIFLSAPFLKKAWCFEGEKDAAPTEKNHEQNILITESSSGTKQEIKD